ncbi:SIR2 family protein [Mammaliicoccus sciuri]|uniref:SIR2 family protein n=1 Tax=Mammaliicoccus sciuri TaxID=1296 RepID=UPI001FB38B1D|nr:SIR2 family protein [Mammaliicoccus sciuri]MCJ0922454.1 SIR2 family protein [Mammaliicoccus sciuri]
MAIYHMNSGIDQLEGLSLEEKHEKISTFINKQISSNNLALFIGSGCSVGAIQLMSVTMKEILKVEEVFKVVQRFLDVKGLKEFNNYVKNNDFVKEIKNEIENHFNNKKFENLNEYRNFLVEQHCEMKDSIEEAIVSYYNNYTNIEELLNWIQNGLHYDSGNSELENVFKIIKDKFIETIPLTGSEKYTKETYDIYRKFYRYIFEKRTELKSKVSIFTTNYDLFNEYALEANNIVYSTGFQNTIHKKFDINQFKYRLVDDTNRYKEKWQPITKEANLYKIHGSINWEANDDGELQQRDNTIDNPKVVIYPTMLKHKETAQAPYSELFREFANCLQKKDTTLIIIGYGFPDEHINNIIAQNLKNQDFNLIIFGDETEENVNNFCKYNKNSNLHIIGGEVNLNKHKDDVDKDDVDKDDVDKGDVDKDDVDKDNVDKDNKEESTQETEKAHHFNYIVENFLKSHSSDISKGEINDNA